ncbi:MAG: hypothetical protein EON58_17360 [Alphaproteobacteria bacterium]|nr:MAG: hypothetical protein EON58_17360 [Alphaproteobacteria bacterium]
MTQTALLLLALAPTAGVVQPSQTQVQQEEPTVVLPDVEHNRRGQRCTLWKCSRRGQRCTLWKCSRRGQR